MNQVPPVGFEKDGEPATQFNPKARTDSFSLRPPLYRAKPTSDNFHCTPNVLLHLQTQAAKRLGRGLCESKGRDRCGCRVQAIVIQTLTHCLVFCFPNYLFNMPTQAVKSEIVQSPLPGQHGSEENRCSLVVYLSKVAPVLESNSALNEDLKSSLAKALATTTPLGCTNSTSLVESLICSAPKGLSSLPVSKTDRTRFFWLVSRMKNKSTCSQSRPTTSDTFLTF